MSENFTINEPIEIKDKSKEKVAFDLAMDIASREKIYENPNEYRQKILDLYAECLEATGGCRDFENT